MSDDPDAVVEHRPEACACCGASLHAALPAEVVSVAEQIELPAVAPIVTQHQRLAVRCPSCGERVVAPVPEAARGTPFGPRRHAVATYLKTFQALSYERLQAALSDLLGLTLSQGGLMNLLRSIDDEAVKRLVALTLEEAPANATRWSTRTMAHRTGMSQSAVSRIWRAFGLRPHQTDTFKLSADPAFVEKVRDVVGLYLALPDRALVLRVDEKPQIQAVQGTAAAFPLRPGRAERVTHDYRRHGTLDLFAALDVKAGTVIGSCKPRHRSVEFRAFLEQVENSVARDLEVHSCSTT